MMRRAWQGAVIGVIVFVVCAEPSALLVRLRLRLDINADVQFFKTQFGDVD